MRILARPSFQRTFHKLPSDLQEEIKDSAAQLSHAFGKPHVHAGMGIRKLGGYFEFRVGLKWRVLFIVRSGEVVLVTVGDHDHIVAFVRGKPKG